MRTTAEILQQLKQLDTDILVELLDISAEALVDRFEDIIIDNADKLDYDLEQWFESDTDDYNIGSEE